MWIIARSCESSDWNCGEGYCIPLSMHCDGVPQCPDMSDEDGCAVCRYTHMNVLVLKKGIIYCDLGPYKCVNDGINVFKINSLKHHLKSILGQKSFWICKGSKKVLLLIAAPFYCRQRNMDISRLSLKVGIFTGCYNIFQKIGLF